MSGETDLAILLESLSPELADGEYVFCSLESARYGDHAGLEPFAAIRETEGMTLILPRTRADAAGLAYAAVFRRITLQVHSSLEAVGLTAAVSSILGEQGISANVVAGFYHDHVFVQADAAARAVAALEALARRSRESAGR